MVELTIQLESGDYKKNRDREKMHRNLVKELPILLSQGKITKAQYDQMLGKAGDING